MDLSGDEFFATVAPVSAAETGGGRLMLKLDEEDVQKAKVLLRKLERCSQRLQDGAERMKDTVLAALELQKKNEQSASKVKKLIEKTMAAFQSAADADSSDDFVDSSLSKNDQKIMMTTAQTIVFDGSGDSAAVQQQKAEFCECSEQENLKVAGGSLIDELLLAPTDTINKASASKSFIPVDELAIFEKEAPRLDKNNECKKNFSITGWLHRRFRGKQRAGVKKVAGAENYDKTDSSVYADVLNKLDICKDRLSSVSSNAPDQRMAEILFEISIESEHDDNERENSIDDDNKAKGEALAVDESERLLTRTVSMKTVQSFRLNSKRVDDKNELSLNNWAAKIEELDQMPAPSPLAKGVVDEENASEEKIPSIAIDALLETHCYNIKSIELREEPEELKNQPIDEHYPFDLITSQLIGNNRNYYKVTLPAIPSAAEGEEKEEEGLESESAEKEEENELHEKPIGEGGAHLEKENELIKQIHRACVIQREEIEDDSDDEVWLKEDTLESKDFYPEERNELIVVQEIEEVEEPFVEVKEADVTPSDVVFSIGIAANVTSKSYHPSSFVQCHNPSDCEDAPDYSTGLFGRRDGSQCDFRSQAQSVCCCCCGQPCCSNPSSPQACSCRQFGNGSICLRTFCSECADYRVLASSGDIDIDKNIEPSDIPVERIDNNHAKSLVKQEGSVAAMYEPVFQAVHKDAYVASCPSFRRVQGDGLSANVDFLGLSLCLQSSIDCKTVRRKLLPSCSGVAVPIPCVNFNCPNPECRVVDAPNDVDLPVDKPEPIYFRLTDDSTKTICAATQQHLNEGSATAKSVDNGNGQQHQRLQLAPLPPDFQLTSVRKCCCSANTCCEEDSDSMNFHVSSVYDECEGSTSVSGTTSATTTVTTTEERCTASTCTCCCSVSCLCCCSCTSTTPFVCASTTVAAALTHCTTSISTYAATGTSE